jgi:hypothetical protein
MIERLLCALGFHAWLYRNATCRGCRRAGCHVSQILLMSTENAAGGMDREERNSMTAHEAETLKKLAWDEGGTPEVKIILLAMLGAAQGGFPLRPMAEAALVISKESLQRIKHMEQSEAGGADA